MTAPNGQPLADFGDRFLAFLIDTAILLAVQLVVFIPAMIVWFGLAFDFVPDDPAREPSGADIARFFLTMLVIWVVMFAWSLMTTYVYLVEMMFRTGQTIGKRVMKLRIVPLDPRAQLTRGAAALRWLIQSVAPAFVSLFGLLDGLWQLWDQPFRQCLHDKVARTIVVKMPA